MVIVIRVQFATRPNTLNDARACFLDEVPRAKSTPGCLRYDFWQHPEDPNQWLLYQEWESQQHFDQYRASELFAEVGKRLFPLMDGPPAANYFDATSFGP